MFLRSEKKHKIRILEHWACSMSEYLYISQVRRNVRRPIRTLSCLCWADRIWYLSSDIKASATIVEESTDFDPRRRWALAWELRPAPALHVLSRLPWDILTYAEKNRRSQKNDYCATERLSIT